MEHNHVLSTDDLVELLKYMNDKPKDGSIVISFDEYYKLKKSYDEYQTKEYSINLFVDRRLIVVNGNGGVEKTITSLRTRTSSFPDDTHTKLTELYNGVTENSRYIEYLEDVIKRANSIKTSQRTRITELETELDNLRVKLNVKKKEKSLLSIFDK